MLEKQIEIRFLFGKKYTFIHVDSETAEKKAYKYKTQIIVKFFM